MRRRFWFESALALASGFLFILTLFSKEWIEEVFKVDPDNGSGALEWGLTIALAAAAIVCTVLARYEWKRAVASK